MRALLLAALLAGGAATLAPAGADPLPCRVYVDPPEFYYTPWGQLGYVNVAPPHVDCT